MVKIIPAIIPQSLTHLSEMLARVESFTHEVQLDIVDGVFAPVASWPYTENTPVPQGLSACIKNFDVELDLMVHEPEQVLESYLRAGVKRVVIHLESTKNINRIIALKDIYDFELGFSINNDTSIEVLTSVIQYATYVQCMGIKDIGVQGNAFDERVLERIKDLKKAYPRVLISIDGSVNNQTIVRLYKAGVERFVSGSAILGHHNPHEAYKTLSALIAQK